MLLIVRELDSIEAGTASIIIFMFLFAGNHERDWTVFPLAVYCLYFFRGREKKMSCYLRSLGSMTRGDEGDHI